jgi:SAM-dependent methyltransferase
LSKDRTVPLSRSAHRFTGDFCDRGLDRLHARVSQWREVVSADGLVPVDVGELADSGLVDLLPVWAMTESGTSLNAADSSGDTRFSTRVVRSAYDAVAGDYAKVFAGDLERLPIDRGMLDALIERLPSKALTLDLGCGPASVSRYLSARSMRAVAVDLAPRMLSAGRSLNPGLVAGCADMRRLPFRTRTFAGAVAYYSIQHMPREDLPLTLDEIARVLIPEGLLVLATHLGRGEVYIDDFLGHRVEAVGGTLYEREPLLMHLDKAGFDIEVERHRGPLPHEADTQRIYVLVRRRP